MTSGQIPSGTVTAADLFSVVEAARREVGQILTRVEVMDDRHSRALLQLADHETRIRDLQQTIPDQLAARLRALERWQWRAIGVVTVLGLLWALASALLVAFADHHP